MPDKAEKLRIYIVPALTAALAAATFVVGAWVGRMDERARWQDGTGIQQPEPFYHLDLSQPQP